MTDTTAPLLIWQVLERRPDGRAVSQLQLDLGDTPIPAGATWALYFNVWHVLAADGLKGDLALDRLNGDLRRLRPAAGAAGQRRWHARLVSESALPQVTHLPATCFLVVTGADGREQPPRTGTVRRTLPRDPAAWSRGTEDLVPPETPATLFAAHRGVAALPETALAPLTPKPWRSTVGTGRFRLDPTAAIAAAPGLEREAAVLAAGLEKLAGLALPSGTDPAAIRLELGPIAEVAEATDEAHILVIDAAGIRIAGRGPAGVMRGVQSLLQLVPPGSRGPVELPHLAVTDRPRFPYRGLHLDVGRNFHDAATVIRLLDVMALYKLNTLHFHLTEDEGWRLEIPGLPELTEIGARRGHSPDEADRLQPSFNSGAETEPPGTGHYSRADFLAILRHATDRHIAVIPEIELPGHARAAIRAMAVRHDRLAAAGQPEAAGEFLLTDPDDRSDYRSIQGWVDNVVCVGMTSVDRFFAHVVDSIAAMYAEAGAALTHIHVGADEVPSGVWAGSPACRRHMDQHGLADLHALETDFFRRLRAILAERGLGLAGWQEAALRGHGRGPDHGQGPDIVVDPGFARDDCLIYVWDSIWGRGREDCAFHLANAGVPVVLCSADRLYLDLAHAKHPDEPGQEWAGYISTRAAFEFCPTDPFLEPAGDPLGRLATPEQLAAKLRPTANGLEHIRGLQGTLWSEHITSRDRLDHFALPRVLAVAERAWVGDPAWAAVADPAERRRQMDAEWSDFANRLGQRELWRLSALGYAPRVPPVGGAVVDGTLVLSTEMPGLALRYEPGQADPTPQSPLYEGPVPAAPGARFRVAAFTPDGRRSRVGTVVA
ncbi:MULTISPECIES: family 20 glycosylhydrolase [Inquilinus]|uniref:beta-N-acetylhexosaminidase n=1 Tax=Inquilinus ginsengisoli TaxID=363840 RepID=A0ABU1JZI2_9PROT|nr:family 20 glycosylhydrolase [Inquilinus ginsengisoli]MDR6294036.1 hexosaminidase [Inquilinus ginsengisoli]